jgi:hypothetical protein
MKAVSMIVVALTMAAASATPRPTGAVERVGGVSIFRIEGVREFADATVAGAIRRACAQERVDLAGFFAARQAKLLPALIRRGHGFPYCHIFYEPTLPGFRASADDEPITGVFGALDPAGFIGGRKPLGDSLEILRFVLGKAPRPLHVTLTINQDYDPSYWPAAVERHFGGLPHTFETRRSRAPGTQPWAQDYLKSGWAPGVQRILVPYRLFEGKATDGEVFRPLLDGLEEGRLSRSKLSWEGGDLQFARDPRDRERLILFHGSAARAYWGKDLDVEEYAYVLRTEFGADESVDLSGLSGHADYVVTLLPRDATVLLSRPVRGDVELVRAAAQALAEAWGERAPHSMRELASFAARSPLRAGEQGFRERIAAVRRDLKNADNEIGAALGRDLDAYTERYCPGTDACFEGQGRKDMLKRDPSLLARALDGIADVVVRAELTPRLLGLMEGQFRTEPWPRESILDRKAKEIETLGFRVVRIPNLVAENTGAWPGLSYANSLVLDDKIFMPALGLGEYEGRVFAELAEKLSGYDVIPVRARYALLRNGGVHCVFGLVRGAPVTNAAVKLR